MELGQIIYSLFLTGAAFSIFLFCLSRVGNSKREYSISVASLTAFMTGIAATFGLLEARGGASMLSGIFFLITHISLLISIGHLGFLKDEETGMHFISFSCRKNIGVPHSLTAHHRI